jgi:putative transposase
MTITASKALNKAINHKKILKIMNEEGCICKVRAKKYRSYKGEVGRLAENLLNRQFTSSKPHIKLVTDVTEFKTDEGKVYLSPIMDLYNQEILAYSVSKSPNLNMIQEMMDQLIPQLEQEDKPILHSDQGWQYQQKMYQRLLSEYNMTQSMSRKANCLDNAMIENFFSHLKSEYYHQSHFNTNDELIDGLHEYIEFYNKIRIKTKGSRINVGVRVSRE